MMARMGKWDNNDRGVRGGSWNNTENNLRASNRNSNTPTNENNNIGFRLASLCARMGQPIWRIGPIHGGSTPATTAPGQRLPVSPACRHP